jgi:uncharacterized phage protein (TIGR01671 family)
MIPKFRVWIKTEKCFADYIESIRFYINEIDLCWGGICESDCFDFNDVILMQSTGLRDKNGKEIFEGDIVQFEDCHEVSDFLYINTGIIEWCQGGFHVTNRDSVLMEDLLDGDSLDVTIIGNIYETPELLEDK